VLLQELVLQGLGLVQALLGEEKLGEAQLVVGGRELG
jgi:hypothetical protein